MEMNVAVNALAALAQETRLSIFRLLVRTGDGGLAVGDIGTRLQLSPATLSFHLKELQHAGLVTSQKSGRFIYFSANYRHMNALVNYLQENCCVDAVVPVEKAARRSARHPVVSPRNIKRGQS